MNKVLTNLSCFSSEKMYPDSWILKRIFFFTKIRQMILNLILGTPWVHSQLTHCSMTNSVCPQTLHKHCFQFLSGLKPCTLGTDGSCEWSSFAWKLLAYNSCFISRNDTKILWSKSLSINRSTNSGEMLNLINPIGSWKQVPFMAADSKWRP